MRVLKWSVPVDDHPHAIGRGKVVLVDSVGLPSMVQVWTEERENPRQDRRVQVFGTGHEVPDNAEHLGSVVTAGGALVWHVYEVGTG